MMTSNRNMIPADEYIAEMQKAASTHTPEELDWVNKQALKDHMIDLPTYHAVADGLAKSRLWGKPIRFYTPAQLTEANRLIERIDDFIEKCDYGWVMYETPIWLDNELGWTVVLACDNELFQAILVAGEVVFFHYGDQSYTPCWLV